MKRLHIGLKVDDIETGVDFHTRLFGTQPTLQRGDYAKWMLDDPRVNFAIDTHGDGPTGSAHYGIQLETMDDLEDCRAHVDGLKWELFYTEGIVNEGYGCCDAPTIP